MKMVFVDTAFWVATLDPTDQLHNSAIQASEDLEDAFFVTTDAVLLEVLNYFAKSGPHGRTTAADFVKSMMLNTEEVEVVYHGRALLVQGIDFYRNRADKGYSLTDCISMLVMQDRNMREVLTSDKHFRQEGFVPLFEF
jgi:uncharacterized protein